MFITDHTHHNLNTLPLYQVHPFLSFTSSKLQQQHSLLESDHFMSEVTLLSVCPNSPQTSNLGQVRRPFSSFSFNARNTSPHLSLFILILFCGFWFFHIKITHFFPFNKSNTNTFLLCKSNTCPSRFS